MVAVTGERGARSVHRHVRRFAAALSCIRQLGVKFHAVACQLQLRYGNRNAHVVNDEYDVQDLLHGLLRMYFDDIREEDPVPHRAGTATRVDFLLKEEQIVIETKMVRRGLYDKKLGEELILDINYYQAHPDCRFLLCLVYDPDERLKNPKGLENDLSGTHDGILVQVLIVPKR